VPPYGIVVAAIGVAALAVVHLALARWRQRRLLARIRQEWGSPRPKVRDVSAIASYHVAITGHRPDESLDRRTWNDLNLDEVFALLDRTESSIGQQLLYHRLRSLAAVDTLWEFEELAEHVTRDLALRERCQVALARLSGVSGYQVWSLAQPGAIDVRPWHRLFPVISASMFGMTLAAIVWPQLLPFVVVTGVGCLALRLANSRRVWRVVETFRFVGPLVAVAAALRTVHSQGHQTLTAPLHDDVPLLTRLRVLSGWLARDSASLDPLSTILVEALNSLFLLDPTALFLGARDLRTRGPALLRTLAAVGEIDAAIAVASYRAGTGAWTRPVLRPPGSSLAIRDLRHPLLPDAVPNTIALAPPHGMLITGSNMSGKSTLLRSLGLAVVLGQTVNTCPASAYEAPVLRVRSCIGRGDSLAEGKSYYLDEVEAVVGIIRASQTPHTHLFLFDELFRGTNAVERIAASEATLRELMGTTHIVVAATHDVEIVALLDGVYASFHLVDRIEPDGLVFEYRLAPGPSTTRNAITLLELNGAPATLVRCARERSEDLSRAPRTRVH
jgi:hypothetical protein